MSGLDEAERAARLVIQLDGHTAPGEGRIATDIARALLAVMPTIRAAEAKADELKARINSSYWTGKDCELMDAVNAMRASLAGESR